MYINKQHEEAMTLLKGGKPELALEVLNLAIEKAGEHVDLLSDRGVIYIHLNQKESALEAFNTCVMLQPNYAYRYSSRAYARSFFGDIDGAIEDYERATQLDKEDAVSYNNLGLLLEQKGRMPQAKEHFERADNLMKQEQNLLEVVDKLEHGETEISSTTEERKTIPPVEERYQRFALWKEMGRIFTSRQQFNEFLHFLKNGFKAK